MTKRDQTGKPKLPASFPKDFTGKWKGWYWKDGNPEMIVGHDWPRSPGTVALHD